ncbi:hypothetical protein R7D97_24425 [Vibrio sp. Vb5031]|uniref:hypothetical protein n=1 Tax=Vibrio TaxID=662 RepID=UPI001BD5FDD6|nr:MULTISPECIES: hypothetical protein [Vibrio]ELA8471097.1 hypothetical protein [Vibrio alginolyticus]MBS9976748.1 hypothetical protein [Vibrio alginolyticus]MBT0022914.1 hypothetical protein [Vibrio alginolyticus]MCS0213869.1 hypothetical protein [Vibrio alginolyticus]MCS0250958.1 hypothetical protein [Vibrio alginolyticus]
MDDLITDLTKEIDGFSRTDWIVSKGIKVEWELKPTPIVVENRFTNPSHNCIALTISNTKHRETYFVISYDHEIKFIERESIVERFISTFKLCNDGRSIVVPDFGQGFFADKFEGIHPIFVHLVSGFYFDMTFEELYSSVYPEEQA